MRATLILTGLLLVAGLAVAPTAAAVIPHPCDVPPAGNNTCWAAADTVSVVAGYATCYLYTAPYQWTYYCL